MTARCDRRCCPAYYGGMLECGMCGHDPMEEMPVPTQPFVRGAKFKVGDQVEKFTGDYTGRGEVRAVWTLWEGGPIRYCVTHKIEDGTGFVAHIYSEANLRAV